MLHIMANKLAKIVRYSFTIDMYIGIIIQSCEINYVTTNKKLLVDWESTLTESHYVLWPELRAVKCKR